MGTGTGSPAWGRRAAVAVATEVGPGTARLVAAAPHLPGAARQRPSVIPATAVKPIFGLTGMHTPLYGSGVIDARRAVAR